jgi:predicted kinase
MMSGLPGSGKDTWLSAERSGLPVVSLDAIRRELGVHPRDNQGRVVQLSRERAREHLRAGTDFAWNATCLTEDTRRPLLQLFRDYNARVHIVCLEVHPDDHRRQNRDRDAPVPQAVIERMVHRWQTPDLREAHTLSSTGWKDR